MKAVLMTDKRVLKIIKGATKIFKFCVLGKIHYFLSLKGLLDTIYNILYIQQSSFNLLLVQSKTIPDCFIHCYKYILRISTISNLIMFFLHLIKLYKKRLKHVLLIQINQMNSVHCRLFIMGIYLCKVKYLCRGSF